MVSDPFAAMPPSRRHEEPGCTLPMENSLQSGLPWHWTRCWECFIQSLMGLDGPQKCHQGDPGSRLHGDLPPPNDVGSLLLLRREGQSHTEGAEDCCCCSLEVTLAHWIASARSRRLPAVRALAAGQGVKRLSAPPAHGGKEVPHPHRGTWTGCFLLTGHANQGHPEEEVDQPAPAL